MGLHFALTCDKWALTRPHTYINTQDDSRCLQWYFSACWNILGRRHCDVPKQRDKQHILTYNVPCGISLWHNVEANSICAVGHESRVFPSWDVKWRLLCYVADIFSIYSEHIVNLFFMVNNHNHKLVALATPDTRSTFNLTTKASLCEEPSVA